MTASRPISGDVQALLETLNGAFPPLGTEVTDADEARRRFAALRGSPIGSTPVAAVWNAAVEGPEGAPIALRHYRPEGAVVHARVLFVHGGGWVLGGLDSHDELARRLAVAATVEIVAVDYRLAPEHPFPAALHDVYAVLQQLSRDDPSRPLILAGDSAGGNLAVAAALMARDRHGPAVRGLLLLYPVADAGCASPSYTENATGYYITADHLRWFWSQYLADEADGRDPYVSLVDAPDLAGLPPTHVVTAALDPLRDEGEALARHLGEAGVEVSAARYEDAFHGFILFGDQLAVARRAQQEVGCVLARLVGEGPGAGAV